MEVPDGVVRTDRKTSTSKLLEALYGFKQAPRTWNPKMEHSLKNLGVIGNSGALACTSILEKMVSLSSLHFM